MSLAFQGGEPTLMGLDFFRRAVGFARQYAPPEAQIEYSLQTNGTLLDEAWCDFFRENNFLIGLSLDGPQPLHDAYRVDKGGSRHSTGDDGCAADAGAPASNSTSCAPCMPPTRRSRLRSIASSGTKSGRSSSSSSPSWSAPRRRRWPWPMRDGASAGRRAAGTPTARSTPKPAALSRSVRSRAEQWGHFLIAIFEEWVRRDVGTVFVQMFDAALASWVGGPPALCIFGETCGNALAMEHNGDLYACDHYVEPDFFLGNITQAPMIELVASDKQRTFGTDKRDSLPRYCRECDVRFACQGECPRNRFITDAGRRTGSLNYLCAGYKAFFHHVDRPMRIMADLLRRQRPPAEIMQLVAAEDAKRQEAFAKAGRNDPCPCGSGRKFKQCHGRRDRPRL